MIVNQHQPGYVVVELNDGDLYASEFDTEEEAREYMEQCPWKLYLISCEYSGCGSYDLDVEPHT